MRVHVQVAIRDEDTHDELDRQLSMDRVTEGDEQLIRIAIEVLPGGTPVRAFAILKAEDLIAGTLACWPELAGGGGS